MYFVNASSVRKLKNDLKTVDTVITAPKKPYESGPKALATKIPWMKVKNADAKLPKNKIVEFFVISFNETLIF